jgi:hypothetical protein
LLKDTPISVEEILQLKPNTELIKCLPCTLHSQIVLHHTDGQEMILYDGETSEGSLSNMRNMVINRSQAKELLLRPQELQSERWVSDMHFYKEGTLNHRLVNAQKDGKEIKAEIQEYLPRWLRPYVH